MKQVILLFCILAGCVSAMAQRRIEGQVLDAQSREPVAGVTIRLGDSLVIASDGKGKFTIDAEHGSLLKLYATGYLSHAVNIHDQQSLLVFLIPDQRELDPIVVTGTMKPVRRLESPVAVEVYTPQFFKKNPAPT